MLRRLRLHLRRIRYYSASRPESRWFRWRNGTLLGGLVLAIPVLLSAETLVRRTASISTLHGGLVERAGGGLDPAPVDESGRIEWPPRPPHGEFWVRVSEERAGWPLASAYRRRPTEVDLRLFDEASTRAGVLLAPDDPAWDAIERAVARAPDARLHTAWQRGGATSVVRRWAGTISGGFLWWIMLTGFAWIVLGLLQLGERRRLRSGAIRAATHRGGGRCAVCGYDLRGLEFHARCPECGTLVE